MLFDCKEFWVYSRAGLERPCTFQAGQFSSDAVCCFKVTKIQPLLRECYVSSAVLAMSLLQTPAWWSPIVLHEFRSALHIFPKFWKFTRHSQDVISTILSGCPLESNAIVIQSNIMILKNISTCNNSGSATGSIPFEPQDHTVTSCIHCKNFKPSHPEVDGLFTLVITSPKDADIPGLIVRLLYQVELFVLENCENWVQKQILYNIFSKRYLGYPQN